MKKKPKNLAKRQLKNQIQMPPRRAQQSRTAAGAGGPPSRIPANTELEKSEPKSFMQSAWAEVVAMENLDLVFPVGFAIVSLESK